MRAGRGDCKFLYAISAICRRLPSGRSGVCPPATDPHDTLTRRFKASSLNFYCELWRSSKGDTYGKKAGSTETKN
jgi:hypothetical protein